MVYPSVLRASSTGNNIPREVAITPDEQRSEFRMQLPPVLSPLDRPVALFILLALLSVFEPVLVLLAVGHGGSFEGDSCTQLLVSNSLGLSQVSTAQVGLSQVDLAQVGPAQVGLYQEDPAQVGPSQVGTTHGG